ncbi:MAG: MATE family efflux transporter [Clostridia bacterium]|nr:MATE family efflux transporter [Clostridia bacterium]
MNTKPGTNAASQYNRMTEESIPRLIAQLSVPTILSMLVTNIYNLVDTAFVGRLGTSESAAVGIIFGFMSILQAVGFMFGQGAGSITARLLGARDDRSASRIASTGIICSVTIGLLIALIAFPLHHRIILMLGSTETMYPHAKSYLTMILLAAPFMTGGYTLNNLLRYEGKASLGMIGLMSGAILNIALDPILMFVLNMGVAGAALATATSQIISFLILLSMFLRRKTVTQLSFRNFSPRPSVIADIMTTGLPSMLRQVLNSAASILLNSSAAVYGDAAVAAMSIVGRISFFVFALALGIGQGFQPVCAFNYGAKKYARLRRAYRVTVIMSETILIVSATLTLLFSGSLISVFRDDPEVISIGTRALQLQMITILTLPFSMATEMLYQSTGHRLGASFLSSARSGLFFIPSLLLLSRLRGLAGIQEAQPLAYLLAFPLALVFIFHFMRNLPKTDTPSPETPS